MIPKQTSRYFHVEEYMGGYAVTMLEPYIHLEYITELNQILDSLEQDEVSNILYLFGMDGVFCKGLDFKSIVTYGEKKIDDMTSAYFKLLERISEYPKFVVAVATGKVMAGGVGIACACDAFQRCADVSHRG